jgi:GT2 family glycosyltransferase
MKKELSVIIVTYNSDRLIFDCLNSIFEFNDIGDKLEVIVVDNCSKNVDFMFDEIEKIYNSRIILLKNTFNGGYGQGNNLGVEIASAPFFVVMNPDVRLVNPIFSIILNSFLKNDNVGLIGVRFVDGSNHCYFKPESDSLFRMIFGKQLLKLGLYSLNEIFFSGSFMAFRKSFFVGIGMFDERIFLYHEEADISNRMLKFGYGIKLLRDVSVLHLAHNREVNNDLLVIASNSRQYYFDKYNLEITNYYNCLLISYMVKYCIAVALNNKFKKKEFMAWIKMLNNQKKSCSS